MRVGVIALLHESNTFVPERTRLEHFRNDILAVGADVRARFVDARHEVAGFFSGLAAADIEAAPIFAARAIPYGTIAADAWSQLISMMHDAVGQAGPLDGLLVAPHGATVSELEPDADGYWLSELRRWVGPKIPIVGTLDPHANLSPRMVEATNALVAYRTNPHLDQLETGLNAADLLVRTLRGEIRPTQAAAFPPVVINIERQETAVSPCRELLEEADFQLRRDGVLSNSVLLGFAYADVVEMGSAMLAITDNDVSMAQLLADDLAGYAWQHRHEFLGHATSVEDAIERAALLEGPICLLDTGDNIGGGSPGDGTWIARALHERRVSHSLVCLVDPAAVVKCEEAGKGARTRLLVGGRHGELQGVPLDAEFTIVGFSDGVFEELEARHGGVSTFNQGRTVVLRTDTGLTVIVASRRVPPFSLAQLTSCGIDPRKCRVVAAKGTIAPVAAYQSVCKDFIRVTTPGFTTTELSHLSYQHRRQPLFPFERSFEVAGDMPVDAASV